MIPASALLLAAAAQEPAARPPEPPPNVVLIVADDLGYGDLGCYGQRAIRTPALDRLAAEGLRFTDFHAGSTVCAPSRCVLMTGLHTGRCWIRGNARLDLRPEDVTVAELLQPAGYATGLFGKWGLGHEESEGVPTRQGFDAFYGYLDQRHAHNYYPSFLVRGEQRVPLRNVVPEEGEHGQGRATEQRDYAPDLIFEEALRFVREHRDGPFFLYLPTIIPHANNEAGRLGMEVPELGAYAGLDWPEPVKAHAAMVTRLDAQVGRLVGELRALGIEDRTLLLFTSDNGPHREGGYDPEVNDSNGPLRGIKRDLYEGGLRVPLVAWWPGRVPAGIESAHVSAFEDLLPTLCELAGVEPPAGLDGLSLVPTLLGRPEEQRERGCLYWEFYERGGAQAVRAGRWKAVRRPMASETLELYDLEADLGETRDLSASQPEVVARMRALMAREHAPSERWKTPR